MTLFSSYAENDSQFARVGDSGFVGMDARTAPDKLPEGVYSYGENIRCRGKEAETRKGNPYVNFYYPDNYPWDEEYANGGGALTGTWSNTGLDADVTVDSGASVGTPYDDGYTHLRFESGLILKVTGEESGGVIPVETQFVANGQSATAETFVWCKQLVGDEDSFLDLTRSVITDAGQTPITTGVFSDPDGNEYTVVVTETSAWFGREHNRPFEVTIPNGVDDTAYLEQAFNKLFLFRGTTQTPLEYTSATGAWNTPTDETATGFTVPMPSTSRGLWFQNRMWLFVGDSLYFSDIGKPGAYYLFDQEARINQGVSDEIQALFPFGKYAMLVFMKNSIHLIDNLYGDVAQNMRSRLISSRIGCGAPDTIVNVGNDIWFCDVNGDVWAISQVDEERMEISGEPVSWPIRPALDEIGIRNISTWKAAYHDSYFYLFVDTEQSAWTTLSYTFNNYQGPNRIAVYDTVRNAWVSIDSDVNLNMIGLPMYVTWMGEQRLAVVDRSSGNVRIIGYGEEDGARSGGAGLVSSDPYSVLLTRGYHTERGSEQQFRQVKVQLGRYDNDLQIYTLIDGVNEETQIISDDTNSTNRYSYLNWANAGTDWDPDNEDQDFLNPYRKDYSVWPDDAIEDGDSTSGLYLDSLVDGIPLNRFQLFKEVQRINEQGNYMQIKIIGDAGRVRIKDISVAIRKNMNLEGEKV